MVLTMPILEGLDGVQKMSKSLNNYIGVSETPDEMFGKVMSVSDDLMWRYFELLSFKPMGEVQAYKQAISDGKNPRDVKFDLAEEIVARFHDQAAACQAKQAFIDRFQKGNLPDEIPEVVLSATDGALVIPNLLKMAQLVNSTSEAIRMIGQGAVKIDGERISDTKLIIAVGAEHIFQVGKRRIARVILK